MRKAGKILVVDDYEANLRGLGQLLRSADYSVTCATNGREAPTSPGVNVLIWCCSTS
jgi:CheY-like chemotaxis protein